MILRMLYRVGYVWGLAGNAWQLGKRDAHWFGAVEEIIGKARRG